MKKKCTIELSGDWVLDHRDDETLPIEYLKDVLKRKYAFEIKGSTLTEISVIISDDSQPFNLTISSISSMFAEKYHVDKVEEIMSISLTDEDVKVNDSGANTKVDGKTQKGAGADDTIKDVYHGDEPKADGGNKAQRTLDKINALVGCAQFKELAAEIAKISSQIKEQKTYDIFTFQSYLFSIGDGCGLTTYLNLLAELVDELGIRKVHSTPVIELSLPPYKDGMEPFDEVTRIIKNCLKGDVRVLSIDISEWMNKTDSIYFKQFLKIVDKSADSFIYVFRIPFVDIEILNKIKYSLNDLLYIRSVYFPPLTQSEIKVCAENELKKYGFTATNNAWSAFQERIIEEKSDGKFYGLNTVKKVVKELIYKKQLDNAAVGKNNTTISLKDTKQLCESASGKNLSGMEQLNSLVGGQQIKQRIEEMLAQIELALKDGSDRPCIHMRFVGNPGTGKTTVARILGKILKERGILRIGNFYEYAGRDFCGRYIGETAPKTAAICRDAYGSVLFIDEAYSLYRGDGNDKDYGREALDTLIAEMENHRNDFVVIMAGYTDEMQTLMGGNIGLSSRMPYLLEFPNFTREQLYNIFVSMVKSKFKYEKDMLTTAESYFNGLSDEWITSKEFSNARFVRNLFERTWAKAAMRCQLSKSSEVILTKDDFERASSDKEFADTNSKKSKMGF